MLKNSLSVCLSTFNEAKNIGRCLNSVKGLASEIILVDGNSQDKTREIALKLGAKIIITSNKLMFHTNKQMAINKAKCKWILILDADEEVCIELQKEISKVLKSGVNSQESMVQGYWIPRKNIIFGKWIQHTGWWPDYQLRLFRRGKAKLPCQSVHEHPILEGDAGYLKNSLMHYHYQNIHQFLKRLDFYTENDKELLLRQGKKIVWQDALLMPASEFIKRFIAWEGYQDGLHGLVLSIFQSFYQFVVFTKLWEANKFSQGQIDKLDKRVKDIFKNKIKEYQWWQEELKINPSTGEQKSPASLCEAGQAKIKKLIYKLIRKIKT